MHVYSKMEYFSKMDQIYPPKNVMPDGNILTNSRPKIFFQTFAGVFLKKKTQNNPRMLFCCCFFLPALPGTAESFVVNRLCRGNLKRVCRNRRHSHFSVATWFCAVSPAANYFPATAGKCATTCASISTLTKTTASTPKRGCPMTQWGCLANLVPDF